VGRQDLVEGAGELAELVSVYRNLEKGSWLLRLHFEFIIWKAWIKKKDSDLYIFPEM
jgi:hypothetical protein